MSEPMRVSRSATTASKAALVPVSTGSGIDQCHQFGAGSSSSCARSQTVTTCVPGIDLTDQARRCIAELQTGPAGCSYRSAVHRRAGCVPAESAGRPVRAVHSAAASWERAELWLHRNKTCPVGKVPRTSSRSQRFAHEPHVLPAPVTRRREPHDQTRHPPAREMVGEQVRRDAEPIAKLLRRPIADRQLVDDGQSCGLTQRGVHRRSGNDVVIELDRLRASAHWAITPNEDASRTTCSRISSPRRTCGLDVRARRMEQAPVLVPLPSNHWARLTTTHRDDHVGPFHDLIGPRLRELIAQIDPDLRHRRRHVGGDRPSGSVPPDHTVTVSPHRCRSHADAICERPELCTHKNNTDGCENSVSVWVLANARSRSRAKRSASNGRYIVTVAPGASRSYESITHRSTVSGPNTPANSTASKVAARRTCSSGNDSNSFALICTPTLGSCGGQASNSVGIEANLGERFEMNSRQTLSDATTGRPVGVVERVISR